MTERFPEGSTSPVRHAGPHPGIVATAYSLIVLAGVFPAAPFFQTPASSVHVSAALQFGAAIPLGIFTATMVSRLHFLGIRAAGTYIALFGGFAAAFNLMAAGLALWVMSDPATAQPLSVVNRLAFGFGGPGFTVPFGLLIAGVSVTAGFSKLLPPWMVILGLLLSAAGELSWMVLLFPKALFLIPLTRFPGFVWMIAAGFLLPGSAAANRGARR